MADDKPDKTGSHTVIVNPAARRVRDEDTIGRLAAALAAAGIAAEVVVSHFPDAPRQLAGEAFAKGHRVIACGGDGLVGQIADVAVRMGGLMGVLPFGSGNDFARHLGIDVRNPWEAVRHMARTRECRVDAGIVTLAGGEKKVFCSVAGTGFDAAAAAWARRNRWLGGHILYIAAVLRTLLVYRPRRFRIVVDGDETEIAAWLVAFGNGRYYGGGMAIAPNARACDGHLDLVVVGPVSRLGFLWTFPKVFSGTHLAHPAVMTRTGSRYRIEVADDGPSIDLMADGEVLASLPVDIDVSPASLRMLVPLPLTGELSSP